MTDDTLADDFDISEYVTGDEGYKFLVDCVSRLLEKYRVIFQMRYMHDLNDIKIVKQLDKSQQTVATMFHRAKAILKRMLLTEGRFDEQLL